MKAPSWTFIRSSLGLGSTIMFRPVLLECLMAEITDASRG
ncbi:hypothetical protein CVCC1112_2342 [Paenarthrobacter nicotinovorans]|nr:hypothetical protein CVCC1112_2342 [Paenarthrobacter nicotinovorans]